MNLVQCTFDLEATLKEIIIYMTLQGKRKTNQESNISIVEVVMTVL